MHTQLHALSLLLGMVILSMLSLRRTAAPSAWDPATLDRFITEQMRAQRVPGLALAITQDNQVLYVQGYGRAREGQPVTPHTQFHIASLSKSFTAVAIMQLVEAHQINLDAPVQRYLPTFALTDPAVAARITVRQLLNHTSGLADASFPELRRPPPTSLEERVVNLRTARPVAPPGVEFHYMNANYGVLARIVEVVSGQPFSEYLQTHIFVPLQMVRTINVITSDEVLPRAERLAQGHLLAFGVPIASAEEHGILGGSGGVISTAADLANYLIMQTNDGRFQGVRLLAPDSLRLLHTPPPHIDSHYAMGWVTSTENGTRILAHNGILSTFYAEAVLVPDTGQGLVLLYNVHSLAQDVLGFPQFKKGLLALLAGRQPTTGSLSVSTLGLIFAAITLLSGTLEIRWLLRLPHWRQQARLMPVWRLMPGLVWAFVPAALVLTMPALVLRTSGRAFGYLTLFRSMLDVMIWLSLCGVLGALNGSVRLVWLVRRAQRCVTSHTP
jgi:CubicO group peptidase (beta-lactamase class C family)